LDELELEITYMLNKAFKRENISFAVHSKQENRPELKKQLEGLLSKLEGTYKSSLLYLSRVRKT
jgi:superfamily II DNA helicase RecQ